MVKSQIPNNENLKKYELKIDLFIKLENKLNLGKLI